MKGFNHFQPIKVHRQASTRFEEILQSDTRISKHTVDLRVKTTNETNENHRTYDMDVTITAPAKMPDGAAFDGHT